VFVLSQWGAWDPTPAPEVFPKGCLYLLEFRSFKSFAILISF